MLIGYSSIRFLYTSVVPVAVSPIPGPSDLQSATLLYWSHRK
jgi:hypothetical protein